MQTKIYRFHFEPIEADETGADILVELTTKERVDHVEIEDAISSYIDSVHAWSYEDLVLDVCESFGKAVIIAPVHTFVISK